VVQNSTNTAEIEKKSILKISTMMKKNKIIGSLKKTLDKVGFKIEKVWGEPIEDRASQITYSALGQ